MLILRISQPCRQWLANLMCCLAMIAAASESMAGTFRFESFTFDTHAVSTRIVSVAQTPDGNLWFATSYGLQRFDGRWVKSYSHEQESASLSDDFVLDLVVDDDGLLWIATSNGLNRLDPKTDVFTRFFHDPEDPTSLPSNQINALAVDVQNDIWVATDEGLARYNKQTSDFQVLQHSNEDQTTLSGKQLTHVVASPDGAIWVVAWERGLNLVSPIDARVTRMLATATDGPKSNSISSIAVENNGNIWIGYGDGGVSQYDATERKFSHLLTDPGLAAADISSIHIDGSSQAWFGTVNHGIFNKDLRNDRGLVHIEATTVDPNGIRPDQITDIYEDMSGNLWFTTLGNGAYMLRESYRKSNTLTQFSSNWNRLAENFVWGIHEDRQSRLWIGTNSQGLQMLDLKNRTSQLFRHDPNDDKSLSNDMVLNILETTDGNIWVTTRRGLNRFEPSTGTFERAFFSGDHPLATSHLADLYEDSRGNLWLSSLGGGLARFKGSQLEYFRHEPDRNSLADDYVTAIAEDDTGVLWIGTRSGLNRYDPISELFDHYTLPNNAVYDVLYDPTGNRLLVGTGDGLVSFDIEARAVTKTISEDDGLGGKVLYCLLAVESGFLAATSDGLVKIHPDLSITNYYWHHGLQSGYNIYSCARGAEGQYYFGGNKGIANFKLTDLELDQDPPIANITGFKVYPNDAASQYSLGATEPQIELPFNHNDLRISFSGIYFELNEALSYQYRLVGLQENWLSQDQGEANTHSTRVDANFVNYTALPPGDYLFEVKFFAPGDLWSNIASISFQITPPWWRTLWAYSLYLILIAATVFGFIHWRTRNAVKKNLILEQKIRERTSELRAMAKRAEVLSDQKTRLFANVSHEFRTPLTMILGPTENLLETKGTEPIRSDLGLIKRSANRLLRMVEQMIVFAQHDSNQLSPRKAYSVNESIQQIVESFEYIAREREIELQFKLGEPIRLTLAEDSFETILTNLISNALKFTKRGGKVSIACELSTANLKIHVEDTGIGISESDQQSIFERFHRINNEHTGGKPGAGIGLAVVAELVGSTGGQIRVESDPCNGSRFTVEFPRALADQDIAAGLSNRLNAGIVELEVATTARPNDAPPRTQQQSPDDRPTVLIIEDNAEMRDFIAGCLSERYECMTAADGNQGVVIANREIPDLIVCDVMMPCTDGFEVAAQLRDDDNTSHIPIILLTAKADLASRMQGWQHQVDEYISKPFSQKELVLRIDNLLAIREILRKRHGQSLSHDNPTHRIPKEQWTDRDSEFIQKFESVISKHYGEPEFRRTEAASLMAVSERQLNRKLSAIVDHNFSEYLRKFRLRQALPLLRRGLQVAEVSARVGFSSAGYFSACFKAEYGQTPTEYSAS